MVLWLLVEDQISSQTYLRGAYHSTRAVCYHPCVSVPSADLIGDNQANFSLELNRRVSFSMLLYQTIYVINTLRPRQNGPHYTDDIFKSIFLNEYVWIPIKISLRIVPKGPINNIPALIQIMAWRRSGDKPLSEPIIASLPTHICVARPQWVNLVTTQCFNGFMQKRHNSIASNWSYVTLAPSH